MSRMRRAKRKEPSFDSITGHLRREWRDSDGELDRGHGPAIEYDDGSKAWYAKGVELRHEVVRFLSGRPWMTVTLTREGVNASLNELETMVSMLAEKIEELERRVGSNVKNLHP